MHEGFTRRGPDWRTWIVILTVALIGATSTAPAWHGEHHADHNCVVCQLRQHTAADLTEVPQVRPLASAESIKTAPPFSWISSDDGYQIPPRAPPA